MKSTRYKYTILKNMDGKYWLWFDEKGSVVDGKYIPNLQPYHEIQTTNLLREGAEIWSDELKSIPEACQLRPIGEYSDAYKVKARIKDEANYLALYKTTDEMSGAETNVKPPPEIKGKKPGRG